MLVNELVTEKKAAALHNSLIEVVQEIRQVLAEYDIGDFSLELEASGRTAGSGAKIQVLLSRQYGSDRVRANAINPAVGEFIRRHGFEKRHAPLELPAPGTIADDDIPFEV